MDCAGLVTGWIIWTLSWRPQGVRVSQRSSEYEGYGFGKGVVCERHTAFSSVLVLMALINSLSSWLS